MARVDVSAINLGGEWQGHISLFPPLLPVLRSVCFHYFISVIISPFILFLLPAHFLAFSPKLVFARLSLCSPLVLQPSSFISFLLLFFIFAALFPFLFPAFPSFLAPFLPHLNPLLLSPAPSSASRPSSPRSHYFSPSLFQAPPPHSPLSIIINDKG